MKMVGLKRCSKLMTIMVLTGMTLSSCSVGTENDESTAEKKIVTQNTPEEGKAEKEMLSEKGNQKYASLEMLFQKTDSEWNESQDYKNAIEAYGDALNDKTLIKEEKLQGSVPHFTVGYIDDDNIPELLVSYGGEHVCGVCIYKYDIESGKAINLGEFGCYGNVSYSYKQGNIKYSYGANGCYTVYISEMSGNNIVLKDAWGIDGSGMKNDGFLYYHGFVERDETDGSIDLNNNPVYDENAWDSKYVISEDEYMKIKSGWEASGKWINVDYDEMYAY